MAHPSPDPEPLIAVPTDVPAAAGTGTARWWAPRPTDFLGTSSLMAMGIVPRLVLVGAISAALWLLVAWAVT